MQFDEHIFEMGWFNHQVDKDLVHHPIETTISKWLALGFPGSDRSTRSRTNSNSGTFFVQKKRCLEFPANSCYMI